VDLLRRSCPKDLEGTGSMLGFSVLAVAMSACDIFGSWLYERSGLLACLAVDAAAMALMFPALFRLPPDLIARADSA